MIDAVHNTNLTIRAFNKHKDSDEFLIFKSSVGTNIYADVYATPVMYLTNKRIWLMNWSFIQTHRPDTISFYNIDVIEKFTGKTPIGIKYHSIILASNKNPNEHIMIKLKENVRDAFYNALVALKTKYTEDKSYMNQDEVRKKIIPMFANI